MKLLFCKECCSVFSLSTEIKYCDCKKTWGKYDSSDLYATYGGEGIPLGFTNISLRLAILDQPEDGYGKEITAFVVPKKCETFTKI